MIGSTNHIIRSDWYDRHIYQHIPRRDDIYQCISRRDDVYQCISREDDVYQCILRGDDVYQHISRGDNADECRLMVWLDNLKSQFVIKGAVVHLN